MRQIIRGRGLPRYDRGSPIPYLAYARKDRQTKPRDPITTRYLAELLEAAGTDAVVTLDVHSIVAFQNAFRRPA